MVAPSVEETPLADLLNYLLDGALLDARFAELGLHSV